MVEIGAGLGSLTLALAETGAAVTAVEVDAASCRCCARSSPTVPNVTVVEADAMRADWPALLAGGERWTLVANLPYNVATPLVCDLLDDVPAIESMLVMVQREVAERFAAPPGNKQYGAVSVKIAYWATARIVGHVPASVFVPRPNVESALVRIDRREPPAVDREALFALVRTAFGQRRKMLRRSLAGAVAPAVFDGRRRVARSTPRAARRSTTGCGSRTPPACDMNGRVEVQAPAKLTLSLRITGVRADGYHLIDAEMVTLSLHDLLTIDPDGDGVDHDRSLRRGRADRRPQHRRQGARLAGRRARRHDRQADPARGRARRRIERRRRRAALGRFRRRPQRRRRSAPTSRSAWSAGAPGCAGSARWSNRCRTSTARSRWSCRR